MTLYALVLYIASAIAFAGVCCRLARMDRALYSLRWHAIVLAHVLLGAGLLARLIGMASVAPLLVTCGLALFVVSERRGAPR